MLGVILANAIMFFLTVRIIMAFVPDDKPTVKANSVIDLDLADVLPEKTDNIDNGGSFSLEDDGSIGLTDVVKMLEVAKTDDKIKGIYIENPTTAMGLATASVLRKALEDFRSSGKFIISFSDMGFTQKGYYLASAGDKVYMNPLGMLDLRGFGAEVDYMKGTFDKLGIKAQIFYCGKYKSATESLRRTDMSPENRLQLHELLDAAYTNFLTDISRTRNIPMDELRRLVDQFVGRDATLALQARLIDGTVYKDQVLDEMHQRLGIKDKEEIPMITIGDYLKAEKPKKDFSKKNKVAVVYCEGSIVDGEETEPGSITGGGYARILRKLREDDEVKAVVLRVNSGGGSALASEIIWREVERLKQAGKVVVSSMGDVAASGGYYIASNSSKIFAEPNTITGSIGVFGVMFNVRQFTNQTLGVTVDTVRTGRYASYNPLYFEMTPDESKMVQDGIDSIYLKFKTRVSNGRNLPLDKVEEIAQGRVWIGTKGKEIGLVDELGGLNDAIANAAQQAGISEYRTVEYPEAEDKWERLKKAFSVRASVEGDFKAEMGAIYHYYEMFKYLRSARGVQARMPYDLRIN